MIFPYHAFVLDYLSKASLKNKQSDFKALSQGYRNLNCKNLGSTKQDVDAYLVGRLPLTFSVIKATFQKLKPYLPQTVSIIDFGCGPGTALLAFYDEFNGGTFCYTGIEEKGAMLDAAKFFSTGLNIEASFIHSELMKAPIGYYDVAIVSYLLNELPDLRSFYEKLLASASFIIVIEPGTPDGYQRILDLRKTALEKSFHIIAPCPHENTCPMQQPKWCHFYERVARSKELKGLKGGTMGYEDEKYSYLILSKQAVLAHEGVIIDPPEHFPYKVSLSVCSQKGNLQMLEIPKKDKEAFKKGKKLIWGDFI